MPAEETQPQNQALWLRAHDALSTEIFTLFPPEPGKEWHFQKEESPLDDKKSFNIETYEHCLVPQWKNIIQFYADTCTQNLYMENAGQMKASGIRTTGMCSYGILMLSMENIPQASTFFK